MEFDSIPAGATGVHATHAYTSAKRSCIDNAVHPFYRTATMSLSRSLSIAALAVASFVATAQDGPQSLPTITLSAGMHLIHAELAQTPEQRATGLMFRESMPPNNGMLFAFEEPGQQCFWMKNTLLPLTAAFVADDGRIVNLVDMQPMTENSHCSKEPVRFVLEMNQGWFAHKNIKEGSKLGGELFAGRR